MALTFSLYCVATIFILPFLRLYTEGVTDISYIDALLPYLFASTYLLSNGRSGAQRVIEYAGHFKLTQNRSIIESIINISVSMICVFKFGIYGVLIGTIVALFYRTNDMIIYAAKNLLKRSPVHTYVRWITNMVVFALFCALFEKVFSNVVVNNYFVLIVYAALVCVVVIPVFFAIDSIIDRASFRFCVDFIKKKLQKGK